MSRFSLAFVIMIIVSFTGGIVRSAAAEAGQDQTNYILVWANPDGTNRCNPTPCWPACATGQCSCCP